MADTQFGSQVRGYVDTINSQKGINWKDISRHVRAGLPSKDLENWLYDNYGMDRAEAQKYTKASEYIFKYGDGKYDADFQKILGDLTPPGTQAPQDAGPDEQARISDWIKQFTEEMSRNVGPGDPMFDSLQRLGAARASTGVGASGVRVGRGGLGELAIQQGAMNATQPYVMQRKQMAQQGLGLMDQRDRGLESLRQGAAGLQMQATGLNNQLMQQQFGQQQDAAGGVGGFIGGALGALGGGIATVATGGAAAPLIPGLIAGGSQVGAGFGQMGVPRPQMQSYRPYGAFGKPAGGF